MNNKRKMEKNKKKKKESQRPLKHQGLAGGQKHFHGEV
jgi:hypothetical protein